MLLYSKYYKDLKPCYNVLIRWKSYFTVWGIFHAGQDFGEAVLETAFCTVKTYPMTIFLQRCGPLLISKNSPGL